MTTWVNGRLVGDDAAVLSASDHGFTVGDGVFETMRTVGGRPFALTRHLRRLGRSAERLGLPPPDAKIIRRAVAEVLDQADLGDTGRVRVTCSSGLGPPGSQRGPGPMTVVVTAVAGHPWPSTETVVLSPWPRNERSPLAGVKSTSYAQNAVSLAWGRDRGAGETILLNLAGHVCEGTGSNVFAVIAGKLVTPPLESGCLAGVTRELVLHWCGGAQRTVMPQELLEAEEVFLTSSTRDVHPVSAIDGTPRAVGPVTRRCRDEFLRRVRTEPDP